MSEQSSYWNVLSRYSSASTPKVPLFSAVLVPLTVMMAGTHILQSAKFILPSGQFKNLHLSLALLVTFCVLGEKASSKAKAALFAIAGLLVLLPFSYIHLEYLELVDDRVFGANTTDIVIGVILAILTFGAAAIAWGRTLPAIGAAALAYGYYGYLLPGDLLYHTGIEFDRLVSYTSIPFFQGLLGSLTGLSGTLIFIFMLFAGLLKSTGGIDFIISMAKRLGERARSGPAQVAVFGSGFMGMVSGSTVANVASTGSITIPMMKRYGFRPEHAAAIEAVASTGGQFVPPVMGLTAFLIVGITGIPYRTIMLAAVFPALIYYGNLAVAVHLQAHAGRIGTARDAETSEEEFSAAPAETLAAEFARYSHLLVAVGILVYLLILQMPPAYAGLWAIFAITVLETGKQLFLFRDRPLAGLRHAVERILRGFDDGVRNGATLAIIIAVIGIVVDILVITGFAQKLSHLMLGMAEDQLWVLLGLAAAACLVFGLGMPTPAAYSIVAVLGAPALVEFGVQLLSAHMLVFYFANMSALTPPIAVAALVGANLAQADYFKTTFAAVRLGLPGFILPFLFVYRPELLLLSGSLVTQFWAFASVMLGFVALNIALTGRVLGLLRAWQRAVTAIAAIGFFASEAYSTIIACVVIAAVGWQSFRDSKAGETIRGRRSTRSNVTQNGEGA